MKLLWIGGTHPRHLYYANRIHRRYPLTSAILEVREDLVPAPPDGLERIDHENFVRHFADRQSAENRFFGTQILPTCDHLTVTADTLNSERAADFARALDPDIVLIFGCGLIKEPLISALPATALNFHLGLSPRYRGAATLFWPFYFLEPTYAGATFHYIVAEPDAGDVVHHSVPRLDASDGIHDVSCKTIEAAAEDAERLLGLFSKTGRLERHHQRGTGKLFLEADFKPQHLRVIYNLYDNDLVRHVLEGRLPSRQPRLVRQF